MKKFEIWTDTFEIRLGRRKGDVWTDVDILAEYHRHDNEPRLVASFETLDEARAEFRQHYASYGSTHLTSAYSGGYLLTGVIAWLEPADYDEDGNLIQVYDWLAESVDPYTPDLSDLDLAHADTDLIVSLINAEPEWNEAQYAALCELADRAGIDPMDYEDDSYNLDTAAFVRAIQADLHVDLGE